MSQLLNELRKKYRTPADAVKALGLDTKLLEKERPVQLPSQAVMAKRVLANYLGPRLAQDARISDLDTILRDVTERNWKPDRIIKQVQRAYTGKLAQDADLTEIAQALAAIAPTVAAPDPGDPMGEPIVAAAPPEVGPDPAELLPDDAAPPVLDPSAAVPPDPDNGAPDDVTGWLQANYPDILAEFQAKGGPPAPDAAQDSEDCDKTANDEDDEDDDDTANDEDDDDVNRPAEDEEDDVNRPAQDRVRGGANIARGKRGVTKDADLPPNKPEGPMLPPDIKPVSKTAMDAAIKEAQQRERDNQRQIMKAAREVRPWVGDFAMDMAFDSATDVYKRALEALKVPTKGVHPDAFAPILRAQPKPGLARAAAQGARVAQDGKSDGLPSFSERFPGAARTVIG